MKEESERQNERDKSFFECLVQPAPQPQTSFQPHPTYPPSTPLVYHSTRNQIATTSLTPPFPSQNFTYPHMTQYFITNAPRHPRYGMTNARTSSTITRPSPAASLDFDSQGNQTYSEQLMDANFP